MRVLMLTLNGRDEASTRYRFLQLMPELERRGHTWQMSAFYPSLPGRRSRPQKLASWMGGLARQTWATLRAGQFDLVVVQRFVTPWLLNELVCFVRQPIVYDFDDAVWMAKPPRFAPPAEAVFAALCGHAKIVVAGNTFLANEAGRHAADVRVVPTVVDTTVFRPQPRHHAPPLVGWIGSPSTYPYLKAKLPLLQALAREGRIRLRIVGAPELIAEAEQPAWSEADEPQLFAELDIGVYPLADDAWSRGKCGLKSIQYMSCGVPHVGSPVGVAPEICGDAALYAESDGEWRAQLLRLIGDPALRRTLGDAGRVRAAEYALQRWAKHVVSIYEEAVKP